VLAYAFLARGSVSYLTGLRWPHPSAGADAWVDRADEAIRACTRETLPWWLDQELWEVELEQGVRPIGRALTAHRGRLLRQVEEWGPGAATELVAHCAHRVRDHAVEMLRAEGRADEADLLASADDLAAIEEAGSRVAAAGSPAGTMSGFAADVVLYARDARDPVRGAAVAAYIAAAALAGGDKHAPGYDERFADERRRQAAWLTARLRL
jgi:hypothetical protein